MAQQTINIGAVANDGTGDRPRTVGQKVNANFSELYSWARERVSSNRTYYVATTGSDSNTGLSLGVALLTIQKAVDIISNTLSIDAGVVITIQVSNGSYTLTSGVILRPYVGPGSVQILGNTGTPGSAIIQTASATELFVSYDKNKPYFLSGFRLQATAGSPTAILADGGYIQTGNLEFNTGLGAHLYAINCGLIDVQADYAILGNATIHVVAEKQGQVNYETSLTITLTGTPAFNTFAIARTLSLVYFPGATTITGSATGKRYFSESNAVIDTEGSGSTFIPGNVAGSTATGGQYV
jgi:hypothetical protein